MKILSQRRYALCALAALTLTTLTGCGSGAALSENAAALQTNRSLWTASATASYAFTIQKSAFLPNTATGPARVTVKNGVVESVVAAGTNEIDTTAFDNCNTVPKLFTLVQSALDSKADVLETAYNDTRGYPTSIVIDGKTLIADDEISYTITNFTVL